MVLGDNQFAHQASANSWIARRGVLLMLSRSKSMRLPGKRVVFEFQSTKRHTSVHATQEHQKDTPARNLGMCICLVSVLIIATNRSKIKPLPAHASQIPGLLARMCFLVLSRSKSMRLPGKRTGSDFDGFRTRVLAREPCKRTPGENQRTLIRKRIHCVQEGLARQIFGF